MRLKSCPTPVTSENRVRDIQRPTRGHHAKRRSASCSMGCAAKIRSPSCAGVRASPKACIILVEGVPRTGKRRLCAGHGTCGHDR